MALGRLAVLGGLCWVFGLSAHSQCTLEDPRSAKAAKWLERAKSPKAKDSLEDRMAAVQEALELHPDDAEAWMYVLRDAGALANIRARPDAFADAAGDWRAFLERTN